MSDLTNAQSDAAESIRELIAASDAAALESIDKALEAGRLLVIAKDECKHGQWLPFLARAGVRERQAQRMMQLARSGLKSVTVTDLGGIKGALEFISKRKLAVQAFDDALAAVLSGRYGLLELEAALLLGDELVEMFPEEKRGPMRRHKPEHDALRIVQRIAAAKTEQGQLAA